MTPNVQLALGTAQFGMAYGIAGRGEAVPAAEVRDILSIAWSCGVRCVDTASAYGDIEERIGTLSQDHLFSFVSKIPALPVGSGANDIAAFVFDSIRKSQERLGSRLDAILFHRGEDLVGVHGDVAWRSALEVTAGTSIRLGASCYSPSEAAAIHSRLPLAVIQIPGNAFDQRLCTEAGLQGVEVHLRSVFLQGLLLMQAKKGSARVTAATDALLSWERWCQDNDLTPLRAALGIAKGLPGVRYCVVGVDRASQLVEILSAWEQATPLRAGSLASNDLNVIDPRRWSN